MIEKLTVRNFGPITEADIEVGDLTIFVGPQATGKSLTVQILYFFRQLEDLVKQVDPNKEDFEDQNDEVESALEWWFGNRMSMYAGKQSFLKWKSSDIVQGEPHKIDFHQNGIDSNATILERAAISAKRGRTVEVYIPSGRALYGFLPPYKFASRFLDTKEWPGYILNFYETLGRSVRWLNENPYQDKFLPEMKFLRSRIHQIIKGDLQYGIDTVSLKFEDKAFSPTSMAGGQMEIWPFWAIVEAGMRSDQLKMTRIYFDEPEAHLHPAAQRAVVEMIAYLVNQGTQLVLATHSPYVLYAINLLLKAYEVNLKGKKLPASVPTEAVLAPHRVAAYRFSAKGTVHDIKDRETNLIDEEELDRVADDLGTTFTELLEKLE